MTVNIDQRLKKRKRLIYYIDLPTSLVTSGKYLLTCITLQWYVEHSKFEKIYAKHKKFPIHNQEVLFLHILCIDLRCCLV